MDKVTRSKIMFKRFLDLQTADINCDLHMHTTQTDGQAEMQAVIEQSIAVGLSCIAFTEHVRRDTGWFGQFVADIRHFRTQYPQLQLLIGCEAKALDPAGGFDASPELLAECDLVLGSVHRFPDRRGGFLDFAKLTPAATAAIEFELAMGLLEAAPIDVLAHPGGMYARRYGDFPHELMGQLMEKSIAQGIAIEISPAYLPDFAAFLGLCREINPYVSIGSDMHKLADVGRCRDLLRAQGVGQV
jgi:putative hydrolase